MDFYIDESGSSGDLIHAGADITFNGQPTFALAAVGEAPSNQLGDIVKALREKHRLPPGELKSSALRSKPGFVADLVDVIVKSEVPFFIELVDKRYLVCANIVSTQLLPLDADEEGEIMQRARNGAADFLYKCAPAAVIAGFLDACRADTFEAVEAALLLLASAQFKPDDEYDGLARVFPSLVNNRVLVRLRAAQAMDPQGYRRFLPSPDINKREQLVWMLPNLSSLTNIYARINLFQRRDLEGLRLIHDEQRHFDEILIDAKATAEALQDHAQRYWTPFADYRFTDQAALHFVQSDHHAGLQVADVLAGLAMRVLRDHLGGQAQDASALKTFLKLFDASNVFTAVGVNMVVPSSMNEAFRHFER